MKTNILNKISTIYITILIIVFPLLVGPYGYENILEIKYYSFIFLSLLYFLIITIFYAYDRIINDNKKLKIKLTILDYLVLIYYLINIISLVLSPYKEYNLIKGLGRGEGLLLTTIYILNYFYISKTYIFNKKILNNFAISSLLISLIASLQFWGINIFDLYKGISGPHNMSFMSTIGNIDFLSAYYTITITITALLFLFKQNSKKETILYLISLIFSIFIFLLINVDSGKVAFLVIIMILLPKLISNNNNLSKLLLILSIIVFGYFLNYFVDMRFIASTNTYKACWHLNTISLGLFITIILLLIASFFINKKTYNIKKVNKLYYSYIPLFIIGLIIVYYYDFGISFLKDIQSILHGNINDNLGNYRIFLWKRSLILFKDYPILGTGPDTFAMRFMTNFKEDISLIGEMSINDTAANVYLTTLVNLGLLGLLSYLSILIDPFLNHKNNKNYLILLLTLLCFIIQNFFNLSIVIVTPYLWLLLALLNIEKKQI